MKKAIALGTRRILALASRYHPARPRRASLIERLEDRRLLSVTALASGVTVAGSIAAGQQNQYTFPAKASAGIEVTVTVTGGTLLARADLNNPSNVDVHASNSGSAGPGNGLTFATTAGAAGTYSVVVKDYYGTGTGTYTIVVASIAEPQGADSSGGALVSSAPRTIAVNGNLHVYTFSAAANDPIEISAAVVSGASLLPEVDLYKPDGTALRYTNTGAAGPGSGLTFNVIAPTTGTYYAVVKDYYGPGAGTYTIDMATVPGNQASDANGGALVTQQQRSSTLATGQLHVYTLNAAVGTINLTLTTTAGAKLLPQVDLYSPTGTALRDTNTGSAGPGSGLTFTVTAATAGTYFLIVKDYYGPDTGTYNLTATYKPGGPPPTTGTVTGNVFNDLNGDGLLETGDAGLIGVRVFVDANHDGVFDGSEINAVSDKNGNYTLLNVPAGSALLNAAAPKGYLATVGAPQTVTVKGGASVAARAVGESTSVVLITGTVFTDTNGNGILDGTEKGIAGATVYLDFNNNSQLDRFELSVKTDSNGHYSFVEPFGSYVIRIIPGAGLKQTGKLFDSVTLAKGQQTTFNFGEKS